MRKLAHPFVLSIALIACALTLGPVRSDASRPPASPPPQQAPEVEIYLPAEAPVTLSQAFSKNDAGRTVLNYSFANSASGRLDSVQLVALVLSPAGEVKGGQGWTVSVAAAYGEAVEGSVELHGDFRPPDRVLLTVSRASGNSINFAKSFARTLKAYKQSRGLAGEMPGAGLIAARAQQTQNTCTASLNESKEACGCGGLKSFSCNPSTGQFSFECFPKNGCDGNKPAPAESAS